MRWYLNDASLQGQFTDLNTFESVLHSLIGARSGSDVIRKELRLTRSLPEAAVAPATTFRKALLELRDRELKSATLNWVDRAGPFIDDDRTEEVDDYFEYGDVDVTTTGLGEAARQTKAGLSCRTYSFVGGKIDFAISPLEVYHGLPEERYGRYSVTNIWDINTLVSDASTAEPSAQSWADLVATARRRFPNLEIGELQANRALAREPFEASLRDRSLALMTVLNKYVALRNDEGVERPQARELIERYFTGDRAWFTGESTSNRDRFSTEMTFTRLSGESYLAHWHGKISHRTFRLHIEWPLEKDRKKLEVFYLGPKITKT